MKIRRILILCLALSLFNEARANENAALNLAVSSITASELQQHVNVLADDSFEGREAGSRGGRAAGMYLLKQFESHGLKPAGDHGSYFQQFGSFRNILGLLEGSDVNLKNEYILICAHYDHVGYGSRENSFGPFGYVHNGADDNASGVAGLLETIEAFTRLPNRPRRSLLFAFWDGEEKGLLGSKHWVAEPTLPLNQVAFAINIDMIGRLKNRKVEIYGSRTSRGIRRMISENNDTGNLLVDFNWELKSNSDHYPFFQSGIPVLMFHTGLHDDYHRPSDDAHLLNAEGMQKVSRLLFNVAYEVSDTNHNFAFRGAAEQESPYLKQQLEAPLETSQPRFGVRWNPETPDRVQLIHINLNSPAARSGIQVGDQIITVNGTPVSDDVSFRQAVMFSPAKASIEVLRDGREGPLQIDVTLDGRPTRIGLSWRDDEAEPGTAVVTRVIAGSPAEQGGLKLGDRIYEVNGQRYADTTELFDLLVSLPGPIELTDEGLGQLRNLSLQVPPPAQN